MDDVGRLQKADKARKAKTKVRSGYGDQGDERPKSARADAALEDAFGSPRHAEHNRNRSTASRPSRTTA
jgi:hypothetical protein